MDPIPLLTFFFKVKGFSLKLGFFFNFFCTGLFSVLAVAPGDEDAVRCKIVALVKSDAIDKALSAIQGFAALPIDLSFYKVNNLHSFFSNASYIKLLKSSERY